VCPYCAR